MLNQTVDILRMYDFLRKSQHRNYLLNKMKARSQKFSSHAADCQRSAQKVALLSNATPRIFKIGSVGVIQWTPLREIL